MDTRETRDYAREVKFVLDASKRDAVVAWSRKNLLPDGHGAGAFADEYMTTSLYFETPEFHVYRRHASYGRSKFRVRRYGSSNIVFLERKFRTERLLAKRRTTVPLGDLERLAADVPDRSWEGFWFQRRVLLRRLKPFIQMSYDRVARVGVSPTGPVRMTIDTNLRVLPMPDRALIPSVGFPLLEDKCIIEVKYRRQLPVVFLDMIQEFKIERQKVSKYRVGLSALDFPLPAMPSADDSADPPPAGAGGVPTLR